MVRDLCEFPKLASNGGSLFPAQGGERRAKGKRKRKKENKIKVGDIQSLLDTFSFSWTGALWGDIFSSTPHTRISPNPAPWSWMTEPRTAVGKKEDGLEKGGDSKWCVVGHAV